MAFSEAYNELKSQLGLDIAQLLLESGDVGVWLWNVQTGKTIFNDKWADIIGYSLCELEPVSIDTWLTFAHPEDLVKSEQLLNEHFEGESARHVC